MATLVSERRTVRRTRPRSDASDPARSGLEPVGDGRMWWDLEYRELLEGAGLDNFEAVMATAQGYCMRALADRENWRLDLHDAVGRPCRVFLKKHHVRSIASRIRARFGSGPGATAGRVEAENVRRLNAEGIDVMRLVAYGEKLHRNGLVESFVVTEELAGYRPLEQFLRERFPPQSSEPSCRRDQDLDELIRAMAAVVRRFHATGFNHRDLYCCHFFIREPERGRFEIRMIDLQRVQHRRRFRHRWLVKDLAQLAWSLPGDRLRCAHRLAFIRHYLGVRRLRPRDKRLIRQVLAKQEFLTRKLGVVP